MIRKTEQEWSEPEYDEFVTFDGTGYFVEGFDFHPGDGVGLSREDLTRMLALLQAALAPLPPGEGGE